MPPGGGGAGGSNQRFMSLEEECNWILSGREPVMQDGEDYSDDNDEDNTLDDISGDEVCTVQWNNLYQNKRRVKVITRAMTDSVRQLKVVLYG